MTTDPHAALVEEMARKMCRPDYHIRPWPMIDGPRYCGDCETRAYELLLPIVLREKAGAWHEGQESGWGSAQAEAQMNGMVGDLHHPYAETAPNPHRTEEATDGR